MRRSSEEARGHLIGVTVDLLTERGVEGVSLREVARRAGLSHGAPLRHFPSFAALLSAVATQGFRLLVEDQEARLRAIGPDADPRDRIVALSRGYVDFALGHAGHFSVMFRRGLSDEGATEFVASGIRSFDLLRGCVRAAQRAGWRSGEDPLQLCAATWALMHGVAVLEIYGFLAGTSRVDRVERLVDTILRAALGLA